MELVEYLQLVRRWWWMLVLAAVIFGGAAYVYTRSQDPIYEAQVKLFTGGFLDNPNPGSADIRTGTDLAQTYANLVRVRPVLESTIATLNLDVSAVGLSKRIETRIINETSILVITVTDTNPVNAANITNELAHQLINNSPTNLTQEQIDRRQLLENEISALSQQMDDARDDLRILEVQLDESTLTDEERTALETRRTELVGQMTLWQQSLADLSDSVNAITTQTNRLEVVEPALVPVNPVGPNILLITVLATAIGVVLAAGLAYLLEYLDDTFRGPEEIRAYLNVPVLAGIAKFGGKGDDYHDKLITVHDSASPPAEGYRALRTNLLYGFESDEHNRIIVTSARASEGKTTTAANLAVSMAKAGLKTVLIDADLHRPQMHNVFGMENRIGLSNLFNVPMRAGQQLSAEDIIESLLQATPVPKLQVITSGPSPASPAELFGLPHIPNLCHALEEYFGISMIIFDSPPVLAVVDSMALASKVDASVLLVIAARTTPRRGAMRALEQFQQVGVDVVGTVLNRVTSEIDDYYYYSSYGYYSGKRR